MPVLVIPYVFVPGTVADATQVNADFNAVTAIVNALDNANVGALGFYASQIIPTNSAQATFGGTQAYTMNNGLTVNSGGAGAVALTLKAAVSPTAHLLDILNSSSVSQLWVDNTYELTFKNNYQRLQLDGGANGPPASVFFNATAAYVAVGAYFNGTAWVATATAAALYQHNQNGDLAIYHNTGLTIGNTFTPTLAIALNPTNTTIDASGNLTLVTGNLALTAGHLVSPTATGGFTATTGDITASAGDIVATAGFVQAGAQVIAGTFVEANTNLVAQQGVYLTTSANSHLTSGTGAPSGGVNGDYYFRQDGGGGAGNNIYVKHAGSWVAIA